MVSRVLQRTLCIITAFCIPALFIWWFSESILLLLGQDPAIAHLAARYAR
jgi:Na+-driven multidrug efflux pump